MPPRPRSALVCAIATSLLTSLLAAQAKPPGLPDLIRQLADQDATVRLHAAEALAKLGPTAQPATSELLQAIAKGPAPVSDAAAIAIASIGKKTVPVLLKVLTDGDDGERIAALFAIRQLGVLSIPLQPQMRKLWLIEHHELSTAVEDCFVALKEHAVPEMTRAVADFGVQTSACRVLARIGPAAKPAVPALRKLLATKSAFAYSAAEPLGTIGDPAVIPDLTKIVLEAAKEKRITETSRCTSCASALGKFGPLAASAVPALTQMLGTEVDDLSSIALDRACMALGDIGVRSEPVLAALRHHAEKSKGDLQKSARESLELLEFAPTASEGTVSRAIYHQNVELQLLGLQRAIQNGTSSPTMAHVVVYRLEHSEHVDVRLSALTALGAIGVFDETVGKALDAVAKHEDPTLAAKAQEVRSKLSTKS